MNTKKVNDRGIGITTDLMDYLELYSSYFIQANKKSDKGWISVKNIDDDIVMLNGFIYNFFKKHIERPDLINIINRYHEFSEHNTHTLGLSLYEFRTAMVKTDDYYGLLDSHHIPGMIEALIHQIRSFFEKNGQVEKYPGELIAGFHAHYEF